MPNVLDSNGLQVNSVSDIIAALTASFQAIYGADINVDSNSPDGQIIGILSQNIADVLELLLDIYNTFAIENAYGVMLDQRVAINGLARLQGTYTTAQVIITVDRALNLTGLDALISNPNASVFTIADTTGNQYQLVTTQVFSGAGSATLTFQASTIGQVETTANTITTQITTVLGVTAVNNPSTAGDVIGIPEETDAQLRVRHGKMFYLASTGPAASVAAALLAIPDVTDAYVVENATDATVDGTPAHFIWCIVTGGTAAEIGQAIYSKKGPGCGMRGAQSYVVSRPNSNVFTAKWDTSIAEPLHIRFGLTPRVSGATFDNTMLADQLAAALIYKLGDIATIGDVVKEMLTLAPNGYLTAVGVSTDGINYFDDVSPSDSQHYFTLIPGNISIT